MSNLPAVLLFLTLISFTAIVLWPLSVLFHEIGHAIPMLIFAKGSVEICILRNSKSTKYFKFSIWRLQFKIYYDSFLVEGYTRRIDYLFLPRWKDFIITFWGPFFSIILGVLFFYFALLSDLHGIIKILSVGFLIHSVIQLIITLPYKVTFEGQYYHFSDGAHMYHSLFRKFNDSEINNALYTYYMQEYKQSAILMQPIFDEGFKESFFVNSYLVSLCNAGAPDKAYDLYKRSNKLNLSALEISQLGTNMISKNFEKGRELISDAFNADHQNDTIIANKAFLCLIEKDYEKALKMFSYLEVIDTYRSYAKANMVLAKYLSNQELVSLENFNNILIEFPLEPYAHRNKGIFLYEKGQIKEAIQCFRYALKYDKNCYHVNQYIDNCLAHLLGNQPNESAPDKI